MKRGQPTRWCVASVLCLFLGGCAIGSGSSNGISKTPIAERDLLAEAAREVDKTVWPSPDGGSVFTWLTGGGGEDRFSKSDAVSFYVDMLSPADARFTSLMVDAQQKVAQAQRLNEIAVASLASSRVSMNDVVLVEDSIQALREQRDIFTAAARKLENDGEAVDDELVSEMRLSFLNVVRDLSDAADLLAERIDHDRSSVFAQPQRTITGSGSGL